MLSSGRSGSTLLELLLATHPRIRTAGEAQLLPFVASTPRAVCRCGFPFPVCPVWSAVLGRDEYPQQAAELRRFRSSRDAGRTLRPSLLPEVITARLGPTGRAHAAGYAAASLAHLDAVANAETAHVVDASKDLYRLHWLAGGGRRTTRAILLARDPRGFVWSTAGRRSVPATTTARLAARWSVQQGLMARWLRASGTPWMLVRYEELATDPAGVAATLGRWLGVDPAGFGPAQLFHRRGHGIGGNPMQFREGPIELDERWRRELPAGAERLTWAIARGQARRLGYRRRPRS